METAATPAPSAVQHAQPAALRDVEDLHDADLDRVLADELVDAGVAIASANVVAELAGGPGQAALSAHAPSARARLLVTG